MMIRAGFITGNRGKYSEAKESLAGIVELDMLSLDPPEVQADTLEEVAEFSLRYLVDTGSFVLSNGRVQVGGSEYDLVFLEDAGLFIDGLSGFPGVYSAYVFRTIGNSGILKLMEDVDDRRAHFAAVIAMLDGSGDVMTFRGVCPGTIAHVPVGDRGFGFDPIFIPDGHDRTFAQMDEEEKNKISHRGLALSQLIEYLKKKGL